LFIDRLNAIGSEAFSGKKPGGVFAYANPTAEDSGVDNAIRMFTDICVFFSATWIGAVHGSMMAEGEAKNPPDIVEEARKFGEQIQ
jgi:hypothetical protein